MYKNYESRVKDFILDMNNPDTKIEIKEYEERINNPKTEMCEEKEIKKPFIFKGYTTEEDRIKDAVKRNRYLFNLPDYDEIISSNNNSFQKTDKKKVNLTSYDKIDNNKILQKRKTFKKKSVRGLSESEVNKYRYILKNDLIIQPEMRFKPRTDLERVYDIINGYKYGSARKDILNKQLKNIDLLKYKNTQQLLDLLKQKIKSNIKEKYLNKLNNSYDDKINNIENESNKKSKLYFNPKKIDYKLKPWIKRNDLNADAYKILNSFHYKTHFKAAKEVASNTANKNITSIAKKNKNYKDNNNRNINNFNNIKSINKIKDKKSCLLLPNLFEKKKYIISKSATEGNNLLDNTSSSNKDKKEDLINIMIDDEKENLIDFEMDSLNEEDLNNFEYNYTKNRNPFKQNISFDEDKIKILNNIAFQKKNIKSKIKQEDNITSEDAKIFLNEKIMDVDNILIGNEVYNKKNQFNIIANKILGNCKILKHKSKMNDTILKKRKGKLMITHGLSIDEFEKKYGFK